MTTISNTTSNWLSSASQNVAAASNNRATIPTSISSVSSLSSAASGWLANAYTSIQQSRYSSGMLGALQNAKYVNGGSRAFLYTSGSAANALASIAQSHVQDASVLAAQMGVAKLQKLQQEKLDQALSGLSSANLAPPKSKLDPVIYFSNGSTLDTVGNILTLSDGKQIDTTTGQEYVDESALIRMANGAYLDTKNNILHMSDGTKIDTITHLIITA